jgi:hypothetical protein
MGETPPPTDSTGRTDDATANAPSEAQFTLDLGAMELTDDEVNALQNQITRLAVEFMRQERAIAPVPDRRREPYVKIIFVKSVHP